ncbi:hypothetical protein [Actinoplanes sp. L3-i22]|uniref:hypothetical protein n=1 Tax=Actinoplanes sp. L3-i22 TaxID=2836373 RepID=UPI0021070EFF|nr:hypothetical protein [Actinoplanes sp. L3-i22]
MSTEPALMDRVPEAADQPAGGRRASRIGLLAVWPALVIYTITHVIDLLAVWRAATDIHRPLIVTLSRYDAFSYVSIATRGYDPAIPLKPDGTLSTTNLAFFPLFPGLSALVDPILPGDGRIAGVVISWLAGLAAAWGLFAVGTHLRDRRTGIILAVLWGVLPLAWVQAMGYSETLFTALAAWTLYAVLRRNWLLAGPLCLLAGLTRPTAAALVAAVGLAALVAVIRRQDGWRPWVGGALAPLGFLGYVAWVGARLGRADGYFHVQNDSWKMRYDDGSYTLRMLHKLFTGPQPLAFYVITALLCLAVVLLLLAIPDVPWPLLVYAAVIVVLALFGDGYFNAKARLILPAFPLLLPVAFALGRARWWTVTVILGSLAGFAAIYAVYLTTIWKFSP